VTTRGAARIAVGALGAALAFGQASSAPEPSRSFIACPIYRDTVNGRKSGCWLATDDSDGVRYDVTLGRTKPQIGHEILVEGRVSAGSAPCGGLVMTPIHVSVLESTCPSFTLPAEGYPGRRYEVPLNLVLPPADTIRDPPPPPYPPRTWAIEFAYGSDFLQYQYSEVILDDIARYVLAAHPRVITIDGYAATHGWVVSERRLSEPAALAASRAALVAEALQRLGVASSLIKVSWHGNPQAESIDDALPEPSKRRVDIKMSY
jgi:outer membrane protein OmpA-like peptidoglycan-associated protein